jgi:transcriptional regulator with XRE-family HTH domain
MSMNERIRHYIKSKGMTFTFVADRSGINIKKFSRLITGRQPMTVDEYEKICKQGLSVEPSFFFTQKFLETKNKTA